MDQVSWWNKFIHDEPFSGRATTQPYRMVLESEIVDIVNEARNMGVLDGLELARRMAMEIKAGRTKDSLQELTR